MCHRSKFQTSSDFPVLFLPIPIYTTILFPSTSPPSTALSPESTELSSLLKRSSASLFHLCPSSSWSLKASEKHQAIKKLSSFATLQNASGKASKQETPIGAQQPFLEVKRASGVSSIALEAQRPCLKKLPVVVPIETRASMLILIKRQLLQEISLSIAANHASYAD